MSRMSKIKYTDDLHLCGASVDVTFYKILMLSDTYAAWSKKAGLDLDLTEKGLGLRTQRYAIIIDDLKVVSVEASSLWFPSL